MNNKEEITPDGFLKLNLMEAQDPDGGTDELWVTIESMGYNKALELVKVSVTHFSCLHEECLNLQKIAQCPKDVWVCVKSKHEFISN